MYTVLSVSYNKDCAFEIPENCRSLFCRDNAQDLLLTRIFERKADRDVIPDAFSSGITYQGAYMKMPDFYASSPEYVVDCTLKGAAKKRLHICPGFFSRVMWLAVRFYPVIAAQRKMNDNLIG